MRRSISSANVGSPRRVTSSQPRVNESATVVRSPNMSWLTETDAVSAS
jgi:hypothetical protein